MSRLVDENTIAAYSALKERLRKLDRIMRLAMEVEIRIAKAEDTLRTVVATDYEGQGIQTLSCGHSVALPPMLGRFPRERRCEECRKAE